MTTNQLLSIYHGFAAANTKAAAAFDLLDFPNLPDRPEYTAEVRAGELIHERGVRGALKVAQHGIEDPDSSETFKAACQLLIEAARG